MTDYETRLALSEDIEEGAPMWTPSPPSTYSGFVEEVQEAGARMIAAAEAVTQHLGAVANIMSMQQVTFEEASEAIMAHGYEAVQAHLLFGGLLPMEVVK